jgi:hypothetical protein
MKFFHFFFSMLFFIAPAFSQNMQKGSPESLQVKNAIAVYDQYTRNNAPLFNGREYLFYTFKMEGDPFFGTGIYGDGSVSFVEGWVSYNGRKYGPVALLFDIARDQLVVLSPDQKTPIVMHNEFVDSFSLYGHTFIALKEDHSQNLYNTGFYDLLYNGKNVQFLERRLKVLNPRIVANTLVTNFPPKNRFYIHKNNLYYLVSSKKDVFRVYSDRIKDLKKLMRQNHIKLRRKNFETSAAKVTALYDQLTH